MAEREPVKVRNVSVRLPQEAFDDLVAVAKVDGVTMGEVMRTAIARYATERRSSQDWSRRVVELQQQLESLLVPARQD